MSVLLELKGKLKEFYEKHFDILRPLLRFVLAFVCFFLVNAQLGSEDGLVLIVIPLVCAFACSFLPDAFIVYISGLLASAQIFMVSSILGIGVLILFLVIFLLIGRYASEQLFIVLAIPLCTIFHVSYVVPIVAALFVGPIVLPAIVLGVIVRYLFIAIAAAMTAPNLASGTAGNLEIFQYVVDSVLKSQEMLLCIVAFVVSYAVTYFVRKRKANYASQIAILLGSFVMIVTVLFGNIMIEENVDVVLFSVGMVFSMAVAYVIQFFRMTLDYTGTRNLQFEDDEYYYYVKAVPKLKVASKDKTVTRINPKEESVDVLQEEFDKVFNEENTKN